jgi:tetratricopeptide (TPR) repeat protein
LDLESNSELDPSNRLASRSRWWLSLIAAVVVALVVFLLVRDDGDPGRATPPATASTAEDAGPPPRPGPAQAAADAALVPDATPPPIPARDAGPSPRPVVDPAELARRLKQGRKLLERRKAEQAVTLLRAVVEQAGAGPETKQIRDEARTLLGRHYHRSARQALDRARYKQAAQQGREAVRYAPDNAKAWMALGFSLIQLKQTAGARRALERYLKLCPDCRWSGYVKKTLAGLQ